VADISSLLMSVTALLGAVSGLLVAINSLIKTLSKLPKQSSRTPPRQMTLLIGGVLVFVLSVVALVALGNNGTLASAFRTITGQAAPTQVAAAPTSTQVPTLAPTATQLATEALTPSPALCLAGLVCDVIRQSDGAAEFSFSHTPGQATAEFTPTCAHAGTAGVHLVYRFSDGGNGGWGVHWVGSASGHLVATQYQALTFWVRGAKGGEKFQVGLKDRNQREGYLEIQTWAVITTDFKQVVLPLSQFKDEKGQAVDTSIVENVSFGFNSTHGPGDICIDDIAFQ